LAGSDNHLVALHVGKYQNNNMVDPHDPLSELLRRDRRYHFDAYVFIFEALRFAQDKLGMGREQESEDDEDEDDDEDDLEENGSDAGGSDAGERHVSGQELCQAIRRFAHEEYGLMAQCVLNHWGIKSTRDFGEIVFNLIEIGKMRKTPHDRREDFDDVFDFGEALREGFQMALPDSSEESRP
jgi:uncharacterized repeat protein (TIGR04138 family)